MTLALQGLAYGTTAYAVSIGGPEALEEKLTSLTGESESEDETDAQSDVAADPESADETTAKSQVELETEDVSEDTAESAGEPTGESSSEKPATTDAAAEPQSQTADATEDVIATIADVTEPYDTVDALNAALGTHGSATGEGSYMVITFNDNDALKIISHASPALYQNATIKKGGSTGTAFSVAESDNEAASFEGFGSEAYPFAGKIVDGDSAIEIATDKTFYNGLKVDDSNGTVKLKWVGETSYSDPMVASSLSGDGTLTAEIDIADPSDETDIDVSSPALTAPLVGTSTATVTVSATYSFSGTRRGMTISGSSNIGLLANTVKSGTFTIDIVTGLDGVNGNGTVSTGNGNAGLFVGQVNDGAAVSMGEYELPIDVTVSSTSGSAGGLAGQVGSSAGAGVNLTGAVDFTTLTAQGTVASGGLIGKATKLSLNQESGAAFTCPAAVGSTSSEDSGGFIGNVSFAGDVAFTGNNEIVTSSAVQLKAKTNAGAVFGYLDLKNGNVSFEGASADSPASFKSALAENGGSVVYGGLLGRVVDTGATYVSSSYYASTHALTVSDAKVEGTCTKAARGAGGLVGSLGSGQNKGTTLIVDDATVNWGGPWVSFSFGGIVGCIDNWSVADIGDVCVSTDSNISLGAGIAGETWIGTIRLRGTTDLSGLKISDSAKGQAAQIAITSSASPSLIFATGSGSDSGWTLKRPTTAVAVDDLGGNGSANQTLLGHNEVVRLGSDGLSAELIQLDETTHQPRFWLSEDSQNLDTSSSAAVDGLNRPWGRQLKYTSSAVNVASVDEFACLALAIQTRGYFSGVSGIGNGSINGLASATIDIDSDIDLTGTGITGLTQDAYFDSGDSKAWVFSGTLNGNGHTVTLAVGEAYGTRNGAQLTSQNRSEGDGKIYYHNRLGLFGEISGATVNNLTIAGAMDFDVFTGNGASSNKGGDAGSVAARVKGGTNSIGVAGDVTSSVTIKFDSSTNASGLACVGGLLGRVSAASTIALGQTGKATFEGSITSAVKETGNSNVGGIIGRVDNATTTVNANNAAVCGSITTADSNRYTGVGGFIGVISQGNSVTTVNVTDLDLSDLAITRNGNDKTKAAGGLLGHSWGNAKVTFTGSSDNYALKTSNTSLTANSATQVGGLVYAASGVWDVGEYGIDLSGATISANAATKLGLLVCMGGSEVPVGGSDGFKETLSGLYLKNTADWKAAYKVNEGAEAITAGSVTTFDEWVADTRKPDSSVTDSGVNGVVSLRTTSGTLDMSSSTGARNSYENRTVLGQSKQTNGSSRYYYNLDSMSCDGDGRVDTSAELLLWSVYRYAASGIRSHFQSTDSQATTITGTLDMNGYSYYPVDVTGESITVRNATITFHNDEIEAEEAGNKLTSTQTQHLNMHAGLLRNFYCGDSSATYTVNAVILAGSVGLDAETSTAGALLSGSMAGTAEKQAIAKLDITNLTLNGLTVHGVDETTALAPLVACNLGTYTALDATGITASGYTAGTTAATSLFGNLGNESAEQVTASFSNISVPSLISGGEKNAVFTHASLLESYAYAQGKASSATYTFTKQNQTDDKVTFGSEIDSQGEYAGMQLWYYDEGTYEKDAGLVDDGNSHTANKDNPQFGVYLPYVAKGKDGDTYHEIKVNQRIANLTTGCGTYGDPFAITTPGQLYAIANYINTGAAQDEWVVTIAAEQATICSRRSDGSVDNEVTYQYSTSDSKWHKGVYADGAWTADASGATLEDTTMRRYIQSCYLSIEEDGLEVDAKTFGGLGNHDYPFRGVIVGNLTGGSSNATLVINNEEDSHIQGLIPYSYGSVVRNLNIEYTGVANTVSYSAKNSDDGVPTKFFGGVIGCIMGGDNIIDGVVVSAGSGSNATASDDSAENSANLLTMLLSAVSSVSSTDSTASTFDVSASGTKPHLVAIGGYVGAIAGGGVIFRNMSDGACKWRENSTNLYDNPYVGRVIDGFAFSEGCTVDNGDDNYKVNELENAGTACVETSNIQGKYTWNNPNAAANVTVSNAQGLLVLSAIINSGAATGPSNSSWDPGAGIFCGARAYQGEREQYPSINGYRFGNKQYGKVRNATYSGVGSGTSVDDFATAKNDDMYAPGKINADGSVWEGPLDNLENNSRTFNSPYLVRAYANAQTAYICASGLSGVDLEFASGASYDMTGYGTGFTGLSGRYYSNACYTGKKSVDRDRIMPWIACIGGNGATLKLSSAVKEYQDDDYSVAGVGGLFSTITFTSSNVGNSIAGNDGASVGDITFNNCNVSLTYLDSSNNALSNYSKSGRGAGIIAGVTANANSQASYGVYKNVVITADAAAGTSVSGAENAGGFYGSAGYAQRSGSSSVDEIVSFSGQCAPIKLYDCSYSNLFVSGRTNAGGYVGKIASGVSGLWATAADHTFASSSTIAIDSASTDNTNTAGGIFGLVGCSVNVNTGQDASATQLAVMSDVKVTTECAASKTDDGCTRGVGSLVGRSENAVTVNRLKVTASVDPASDAPVYLGSTEGTRNNSSSTAAKNVGGVVGWSNKNVTVSGSTVENLRIGAGEHSGGVVGTLDSGVTLALDGSTVSGMVFDGSRIGGVVGNVNNSGATVNVTNTTIQGCSFSGTLSYWGSHPGGNGNFSGGIVGYALGTYKVSNVLLSENTFPDTTKRQGLLVGCTAQSSGNFKGIYAAGIKVKLASDQTNADVPAAICYFKESSDKAAINQKSYIAFADYGDYLDGAQGLYGATGVSPYVNTSPKTSVSVNSGSDNGVLFGDGAAIVTGETIQSQAGTSVSGRYTYTNIGGVGSDGSYQNSNDYNASTSASTFNANNSEASKRVTNDFPVLLLPGNDTTTVTNYLNLVTNGGFSDAVRLNGTNGVHVSASVETVKLASDGTLVADSSATPTVRVVNNETSKMSFRASSQWDNEKGQFSLLTVTFSEAGQVYKVQVPIIVKRMLEVDFTATYSYGTHFTTSDYSNLGNDAHVLTNFGESMTGYLTWTYNQAKGVATEYGWDTHLASGASMGALGKSIVFEHSGLGALPVGTQLTLVDTAHGDMAYHYTVQADSTASVSLASFVDSNGDAYQEQWLSEVTGVSAQADGEGAWVECDDAADAGAKVVTAGETKYYRAYADGDTGQRYTLTVAKGADGKETSPSESFYLVVNVPSGASSTAVNGYTSTSFDDTSINKNVNYTLRSDKTEIDKQQNTASTYSIYSSYKQALADSTGKSDIVELAKTEDATGYTFPLCATDTISFDAAQQYNKSDKLYYQFGSSLVSYESSGSSASSTGASGFPTGTTGTLNFYVKVGEKYYTPSFAADGSTTWTAASDGTAAATKAWSADGNDLSETLADASGNPYDLSGLRDIAGTAGSIVVVAEVTNLKMSEEAAKQVVAASQDGSSYTKVHYRASLSTRTDTLSTSSMVASASGIPGYYRKDLGSSTIELTASKQSQLGINVDDLEFADGTIGAVGTYSLLSVVDADSKIANAASVKYTLTLQRRAGTDGTYEGVNINDYLSITSSDLGGGSKGDSSIEFVDEGLATRDGNSNVFKLLFEVKVKTDVEKLGFTYANYRIVLTAELLDSNGGVIDTPVNVNSDQTYKNSDYITYTLTRVNIEGISH